MRKPKALQSFLSDENGAVTADWLLMTAFAVGLVFVVATSLGGASADQATSIADTMIARGVPTF